MAMVYASCPVELAALQMRSARLEARGTREGREDVGRERLERVNVAKERRLVGGERLDHIGLQLGRAALQLAR